MNSNLVYVILGAVATLFSTSLLIWGVMDVVRIIKEKEVRGLAILVMFVDEWLSGTRIIVPFFVSVISICILLYGVGII